ncbi:hypothetical protein [Beijerinckia sp. L45]|uniref:hypothetical protein n=1 Tax=Beijerinckia sp. L45 TaxID=1641855 RepID=UPI00131B2611|nr:hypothetical protein [Beijerinckia sp. L45]
MARQAAPASTTSRAPHRVQKLSLAAVVIAGFNKAGLNNVLASAAVTLGAPAAAGAFVYEVSSLRGAQLQHEATDRAEFLHIATEPAPALAEGITPSLAAAPPPRPDFGRKLDGMIASRTKLLDIFGDEPSTVAPIFVRIIRQMLSDDTATFAALPAQQDDAGAETLEAKAERLRAVHARLAHLVGT